MLDTTGIALSRNLGNAKAWYNNIPEEYRCELRDKCIVVIGEFDLSNGTHNSAGHVMFVEKVDMDKKQVYLSEGNFHVDRPNPEDRYNESVKSITWDSINNCYTIAGGYIYGGEIKGFIAPPEEMIINKKVESISNPVSLDIKEIEYIKTDKLVEEKMLKELGEGWNVNIFSSGWRMEEGKKPTYEISVILSYKKERFNKTYDIQYSNSNNWSIENYNYVENSLKDINFSRKELFVQGSEYDLRKLNLNWKYCFELYNTTGIKLMPDLGIPVILPVPFTTQDYFVKVFKDDVLYTEHDGTFWVYTDSDEGINTVENNSTISIIVDSTKKIVSNIFKGCI